MAQATSPVEYEGEATFPPATREAGESTPGRISSADFFCSLCCSKLNYTLSTESQTKFSPLRQRFSVKLWDSSLLRPIAVFDGLKLTTWDLGETFAGYVAHYDPPSNQNQIPAVRFSTATGIAPESGSKRQRKCTANKPSHADVHNHNKIFTGLL